MASLGLTRLKTAVWFTLFPLPLIGILPWWLRVRSGGGWGWDGTAGQWLGLWLILNGLGLAGWCVNLFNVQGRGTPLPLDPPTRFVVSGPYRFVRNPMMLGLLLMLLGEAALYESLAVLLYDGCLAVLAGLFVVCWEEPDLERRFGADYLAYKHHVPRWVPRPPVQDRRDGPRLPPISGAGATPKR